MVEFEKWKKGEPFDIAKLYMEMDDDYVDAVTDGLNEADVPPVEQKPPEEQVKHQIKNHLPKK